MNFKKDLVQIDECMREISSLDELYEDLLVSKPKDKFELMARKEEAKFARERILKLSLHVKHLLNDAEDGVK